MRGNSAEALDRAAAFAAFAARAAAESLEERESEPRFRLEDHRVVAQIPKLAKSQRVEFDLLAALARRPGSAIERGWQVDNVLDPEREGTERTYASVAV